MTERIRSDQRLAVTIAALIFGPLFMLGPVAGGICILVLARLSVETVLFAIGLCCLSAFLTYHMTQNYQWVEFDGIHIRGRRFWTRRLVENTLADVQEIRVLGALARNKVTSVTDAIIGPVRGWEICFRHGPSIAVIRLDMKNAEQLAATVERALQQRGT
ncbi:MAG TPA: hypothetical protein DDY78_03280 [Planctomycetales bacterium]|nr:hypothetical protein [Planctomycetales bacterium]